MDHITQNTAPLALPERRESAPAPVPPAWDAIVRAHSHRVLVSFLGMGIRVDRAKELVQVTWMRLLEQHRDGKLERLEFPGLALAQARFLALDELKRERTEVGRFAALDPDSQTIPDRRASPEMRLVRREQVALALAEIAACSPSAQQVFRLLYEDPAISHADAAARVGLSVQRVRQILCEVRKRVRIALEREESIDG